MAENSDLNESFVSTTEDQIQQLIADSKSKDTNRTTKSAMACFKKFLQKKNLPEVDLIDYDDLPKILTRFYTDICTNKNGEMFKIGSFKVMRAGINRYCKTEKNIDIVNDERFMRANLILESVQVKAKKEGKGVTDSTPHITEGDLSK